MTLTEVLVGVTIIVLVFGATLGALVNGYHSTMNYSRENNAAVECSSLNEIIMKAVRTQNFKDKSVADAGLSPSDSIFRQIDDLVKQSRSDIRYVNNADFYKDSSTTSDARYTYDTNATLKVESDTGAGAVTVNPANGEIKGIMVKTAIKTPSGTVINTSFVPYKQSN